eukprot:5114891-Karenia_brevis.AAC.1
MSCQYCGQLGREYCRHPCLDKHMKRCPQNPNGRFDETESETDEATSQLSLIHISEPTRH